VVDFCVVRLGDTWSPGSGSSKHRRFVLAESELDPARDSSRLRSARMSSQTVFPCARATRRRSNANDIAVYSPRCAPRATKDENAELAKADPAFCVVVSTLRPHPRPRRCNAGSMAACKTRTIKTSPSGGRHARAGSQPQAVHLWATRASIEQQRRGRLPCPLSPVLNQRPEHFGDLK